MKASFFRRRLLAFTLVELLVVIAIIALLVGVTLPNMQPVILRAKSAQCAANLRAIGLAVTQAASDNNNTYPEINQTAPPLPYGSGVPGLVGVLGPYGITTNTIQCPVDLASGVASSFTKYGSSYEWAPIVDDEAVNAPVVYPRPGVSFPLNSSRARLCTDFLPLHRGKMNALYGDGHVTAR